MQNNSPTTSTTTNGISAGSGVKLTTETNHFGVVLVLSSGATVYAFVSNVSSANGCDRSCLSVWHPVLANHVVVGEGVIPGKVGSAKDLDGSLQLTYGGHRLFTYSGDLNPEATSGQAMHSYGGTWYLVNSEGKLVATSTSSVSSSY